MLEVAAMLSNTSIATIKYQAGVMVGVSGGQTVISFIAAGGCVATNTVIVNPAGPIAGPTSVCVGQAITLSDVSGGVWTSNTPLRSYSSAHLPELRQAYWLAMDIIQYTLSTGCTVTMPITVNALTTISGNAPICQNQTITLTGNAPDLNFWSSSNTSVAIIGAGSGVVDGVSGGACNNIIYIAIRYNNYSSNCGSGQPNHRTYVRM